MTEIITLEDSQLQNQKSKTNTIPKQANLLVGHKTRRIFHFLIEFIDARDSHQLNQPTASVRDVIEKQTPGNLQECLDRNHKDIVPEQTRPQFDDASYRSQIEVRPLPQENERTNQVTDRKEIDTIRSRQENNRQRKPKESQ